MMLFPSAARRLAALSGASAFSLILLSNVSAQFQPPSTVLGSISDAGGPVAEGVKVEAYIGSVQCGLGGKTYYAGEGTARVTVYVVDVVSESQIAGCGKPDVEVRIKIGDRFVEQPVRWNAGLVRMDVTFGGATPVPIPTSTPAPTNTPAPPGSGANQTPLGTIPAGSPGAGSPVPTQPKGGFTAATPGQQSSASDDDGGGVPIWAIALLVLGGIGAIGGGVGYVMSRSEKSAASDDDFAPPEA